MGQTNNLGASSITSVSNVTLGSNCMVTWTPSSSAFRYKLKFSIGSWSYTTGAIHPNTTSAFTYNGYTLPIDIANQVKTRSGTMMVTLYTYSDSGATTQVGSASSKAFAVIVPENDDTRPAVGMSLSVVSTLHAPFNSLYIQGKSKVKATITPDTKFEADVEATNITVEGTVYSEPYESSFLSRAGKQSVKGLVKDSRGFYGTIYKEIDVIPYSKPCVQAKSGESKVIAARCDENGELTDSGTYLTIKAKAVWSPIIVEEVQKNYGKIRFRYRNEGGTFSAWRTILDCKTANSDEVSTAPLLNGSLDVKTNYQVQIIASDDLYDSIPVTIAVSADHVYMDRPAGGKGMGLGGYSTGEGLDIFWKTKARGGLSMFSTSGDEIPLDSTMPIPRGTLDVSWDADNLDCGIYAVTNDFPLKAGESVIMHKGILMQMPGTLGDGVKLQLALPIDEDRNPMYRIKWDSNWSNWRSMKL